MSGVTSHRQAVDLAWAEFGDPRSILAVDEVSTNVSTNRVYRLHLEGGSSVISKVSSYGSYFLFVEDHEQLDRCARLLRPTRFNGMLAEIWARHGRIFTWYNQQHRHSGIGMMTPESVHTGRAAEIRKLRQTTLDSAYERTPSRFKNRPPRQAKLPTAAWINPPAKEKKAA